MGRLRKKINYEIYERGKQVREKKEKNRIDDKKESIYRNYERERRRVRRKKEKIVKKNER